VAQMSAKSIIQALDGNTHSGMCQCPAHDDTSPSLKISTGRDGKVLWYCHAGCSQEQVRSALVAKGLWKGGRR
jgi:hypothetical protein